MKCPYRNFEDCIVEECPACNYEVIKKTKTEGRYPPWMDLKEAFERGIAWETSVTTYKFISCKLADSSVQPIPENKQIINNKTETNVLVKRSIF